MREYEGPPDPPLDVYAPGGPVATKGPTPTKADPTPTKNPLEAAWAPFTPGPWPPPPRRVLVAGLDLPMGRVGLLAGQGGVGKSWLSIQLAVCLALADTEWRHEWCGVPTWTVPRDMAGPGPTPEQLDAMIEIELAPADLLELTDGRVSAIAAWR